MSEEHKSREEKVEDEVVPDFNYAEEIPAGIGRAGSAALPDEEDEEQEDPDGSRDEHGAAGGHEDDG